jgi:signal transduction histidine kinase
MAFVEVRALSKRYGSITAADGVSFDIHEGEVFSLLGPNGAGKSTCIGMLSALIEPTGGDARIGGLSVRGRSVALRRQFGVIPQEIALYEELSATDNLLFWGRLYGLRGADLRRRIKTIPVGPRFAWTAGLLAAFMAMLVVIFYTEHARREGRFLAAMLAASAIGVAIMAVGDTPIYGAVLFFILCTIAGMRLPVWAAIVWTVGAAAALLVCLLVTGERDWLPILLSVGVGLFAFVAISLAFRRSLSARAESQQLLAELMSAQGRLRDMAVMEERQRLAREMHDAVGHRLTAAAARIELALRIEGNSYVLTCRDNGRGLVSEQAAPGGTGFGLGNLRTRAAAFGGRVDLESAPDGGALLRLALPAAGGDTR